MLNLKDYENFAPILIYDEKAWSEEVKKCPVQEYKAGTLIKMQGAEDGDMVVLKEGYFMVSVLLPDGTETIQHIGGTGCSFGYIAATGNLPYMSSVSAYTDCKCYVLSNEKVKYLQKADPSFNMNAMMISSMQGDVYFKRISLLAVPQCGSRLLHLLLGFAASAGKVKNKESVTIQLELTHQLISEILQVNRVTVSRLMSNFARQGAIIRKGKYYELNLPVVEEVM